MTIYGMTPTGFVRKPFTVILKDIGDRQKNRIAKTLLTDSEKTALGNINNIASDEISQCWEALEIAANGFDPDNAIDYLFRGLSALSGVLALGPRKGAVPVTVNVDASVSYPKGTMFANVAGKADNVWTNREDFASTTAGVYTLVPFISVNPGSGAVANAGTLNKITSPLVGWNSIVNPTDATAGKDAETIEELRVRRDESLAITGSATLLAVISDVAALGGIVTGRENINDIFVAGLPPHSINIIVHDPVSTDAELAQVIFDSKAGGINTVGTSSSTVVDPVTNELVLDPNGDPFLIFFSRAVPIEIEMNAVVFSANGFSLQAAKDAVMATQPIKIGQDVLISKISAALVSVDGIDDFDAVVLISSLGPPQNTNLAIPEDSIAIFNPSLMSIHV